MLVFIVLDALGENVDDDPGAWSIFLEEALTFPRIEFFESTGMNTSVE